VHENNCFSLSREFGDLKEIKPLTGAALLRAVSEKIK
jgi:hypothetical protein